MNKPRLLWASLLGAVALTWAGATVKPSVPISNPPVAPPPVTAPPVTAPPLVAPPVVAPPVAVPEPPPAAVPPAASEPAPANSAAVQEAPPQENSQPREVQTFQDTILGLSVQEDQGSLVVTQVRAGSAAHQAGLKPGDIVLSVNGSVLTLEQLRALLGGPAHGRLELSVKREGQATLLSLGTP